MGSLADFIAKHGIASKWRRVAGPAPSKDWPVGTHHYSVTLYGFADEDEEGHARHMTVPFHMGAALTDPPTTAEVLRTLADDSALYENSKTVEDLMSEIGEDNYMHAKKIYNEIEKQAQKLVQFLDNDLYKELLWNTERE